MSPERLSGNTALRSDGEVVVPEDIPGVEDIPENEAIIEDMIIEGEIEKAEATEAFSDLYFKTIALLDDGINASREKAHYTIEYQGQKIPLGEFLAAGLFNLGLSKAERNSILAVYIPLNEAHESARHARALEEGPAPAAEDESYEAYEELYDSLEVKNPGGAYEIHQLAKAEARRRGIAIPPHV